MAAATLLQSLPGEVREAGQDDHVDGVPATVVAAPRSTQETADLLRACHAQDLAVVVRGHGSKLTWGHPPKRVDVILETTGMAELVEHSRGDLIATAGAGMPLATLQEHVAEAGHQLALDDPVGGSTLGGAIATNLSGPRRLWVGTMRDLVLGVRMVRADGTIAKAGGKVVKNVAGYDLSKLLVGSYGTLAVITEVTLRLHPLPEATRWVGVSVEQDRLAAVLAESIHSQTVPQAIEVRSRPDLPPAVVTMFTGTTGGVGARADRLVTALTAQGVEAQVHDAPPFWWGSLLDPSTEGQDPVEPAAQRPVRLKSTARLSGIPELVGVIAAAGGTTSGSAGTGVLSVALPADAPDLAATVEAIREASIRLGGSTVVLDAPPEVRAGLDTWGPVGGLHLMRAVKAEFDPTRILAPGRFVGGL